MTLSLRRSLGSVLPPGASTLVWWFVLIQAMGVTAMLPVLPLYAREHGASLGFVGWMVGAYMAANLLALYPVGHLSDRFGRRRLMALGSFAYALASLGFLVFRDPAAFVVLRAIEGVAGACVIPSALAYVADSVPEHARGGRIAGLTAAQNVGMLAGPALGGILATWGGFAAPFWALALLSGLGGLLTPLLAPSRHAPPSAEAAGWDGVAWTPVLGLCAKTFAGGFCMALYEAVWAIYMKDLGAATWQISLSWSLFALPPILLSGLAGRWIDRSGPDRLVVWGTLFSAMVVVGYALTGRIDVILGLGMVDALGYAFAYPAQSALSVRVAPEAVRGRVLGFTSTVGTAGALVGALATPRLYQVSPVACFGTAAVLLGGSAIVLAIALRVGARRSLAPS